jgi:hypothetical protein
MTPSLTPTVAYIYYSNTEYNASPLFLDNNVYVKRNPSTDLVNEVFSTPGDILITGSVIYQGDSIYAQSSCDIGGFPAPTYGTSTRTLTVSDSAGNTVYNFTGDYTTYNNINTTFSIVGGRNYFVRGRTDFSWPTSAILTISEVADDGSGQYVFNYTLDTAVDGDFTIDSPYGIGADMYTVSDCSGPSEGSIGNNVTSTVTKGQYGLFSVTTGTFDIFGFSAYRLYNVVYINGSPYYSGNTFTRGVTTVTVYINTDCRTLT